MLVHGLDEKIQSAYKSGLNIEAALSVFENQHVDGNRWAEGCGSEPIRFIGGIRHY